MVGGGGYTRFAEVADRTTLKLVCVLTTSNTPCVIVPTRSGRLIDIQIQLRLINYHPSTSILPWPFTRQQFDIIFNTRTCDDLKLRYYRNISREHHQKMGEGCSSVFPFRIEIPTFTRLKLKITHVNRDLYEYSKSNPTKKTQPVRQVMITYSLNRKNFS